MKYESIDPRPPSKLGLVMVLIVGAIVVVGAYLLWSWIGKTVTP